MCRLCWALVVMLLIVTAGMIYKFIFQGSVEQSADGRQAIQLTIDERDLVLAEMRAFLQGAQEIVNGVVSDDMHAVAEAARRVGAATQRAVPGTLIAKLPIAFKKLGFDTHARFDELALDAEQLGDREHALSQLSALMQNCVACHTAYRFEPGAEDTH